MRVSIPKLHSIQWKGLENVVYLDLPTTQDIDAGDVLIGAFNTKLTNVVLIGETEDGMEYFASSLGDPAQVLWLLKRAEIRLTEE